MKETYVFEIMTENVATCSPDTPLKEVVKILSSKKLSCLVITNDNTPVGIITERDMVSILADMLNDVIWDQLSVDHFMHSPVTTISSDLPLDDAVELSQISSIRHLPVVNDAGKLAGLITQTDIVRGYYERTL